MSEKLTKSIEDQEIIDCIRIIRGQKVMLDRDLARMYDVPTKRFNEAVKRNITRFPSDFMFQLTEEEFQILRSQIATSSSEDKKTGLGRSAIHALRLHRTGRSHAVEHIKFGNSHSGEYSDHQGVHQIAAVFVKQPE
jgi:hypothetical protein